jgi:hypothetical protein
MERHLKFLTMVLVASTMTAAVGCAGISSRDSADRDSRGLTSEASTKRVPRVQDCGVLDTGTPSRFVCDGKVYTAFQLAKLREGEAKKYAAGK